MLNICSISFMLILITVVTTHSIKQNANIPSKATKLSNKLAIMTFDIKKSSGKVKCGEASINAIKLQNGKRKNKSTTKPTNKSNKGNKKMLELQWGFKKNNGKKPETKLQTKNVSNKIKRLRITKDLSRRIIKASKQATTIERNLNRVPRKKHTHETSSQKTNYRNRKHSMSITEFFKNLEWEKKTHRAKEIEKHKHSRDSIDLITSSAHTTTVSDENTNSMEYTETENFKSTVNTINEYDSIEEAAQKKIQFVVTPETIYNTFEPSNTKVVTPQPEIHYSNKGNDKMQIHFNIGEVKIAIDAPGNMSSEEQVVKFAQKMYENLLELRNKKIDKKNFTKYDRPLDMLFSEDNDKYKLDNPYAEIIHHSLAESSHDGQYQRVATRLANKVRVLCWVMTHHSRHDTMAVHVKTTWGKRCNKLIFMSNNKDVHLPAINLFVRDGRDYRWEKTKEAFSYIFKHHRHDAEWFLKADDDTYIIMENLRYMLAEYNSTEPMYFGCRFKPYTKQGYMSGGAGYVMSRSALDRLNRAFQIPNMCNTILTYADDVELGKCMERIGVRAMDSRDPFGRGRFFPFPPREHFIPDPERNAWYFRYLYYPTKEGFQCCSNTAISFHGLSAKDMYILEYLVYHLRPQGTPLLDDENAMKKTHFTLKTSDRADFEDRKKQMIMPVAEIHYNTFD